MAYFVLSDIFPEGEAMNELYILFQACSCGREAVSANRSEVLRLYLQICCANLDNAILSR